MTINKQKAAITKMQRSSGWHVQCHGLKMKKSMTLRQFQDMNIFMRKGLEAHAECKNLQLHLLQPTFTNCTAMNRSKENITESFPSHKTLYEITNLPREQYKQNTRNKTR